MTILVASLAVISCSSGPKKGKLGEVNKLGDNEITVKANTTKILANDELKVAKVAPEGKTHLIVRTEFNSDNFFADVKKGEEKLKEQKYSYASNFVSADTKGEAKAKEDIYLVNENFDSLHLHLKNYGGDKINITIKDVQNNSDRKIAAKMNDFVAEFSKPTNLLEVVKKYTSADAYEVVTEKGADVPSSPMTKDMEITYVSKDGSYYKCSAKFLGASYPLEIWWSNGEISKATFKL